MKKIMGLLLAAVLLSGCGVLELPPETTQPLPWTMPVSPYGPSDFQQTGDFLACSAGPVAVGIDVSSHQGSIDWKAVADAGIEYAFIRVGYTGYKTGVMTKDHNAAANLKGAKEAGILVGAYYFSQAVNAAEAKAEAEFAMDLLAGISLDLPLVYDWEYVNETARTANVDRATLTECTLAFCQAVEKAGFAPMIYFNTSQGRDMLDLEKLERYPWWLAKYDLDADFLCRVDLWQYTNQGTVPGIQGNVDVDLMFTAFGLGQEVFGKAE